MAKHLKDRTIADTQAGLHHRKRWLTEDGPQGAVAVFRNALGFWVALLLTSFIALTGFVIIDLATTSFKIPELANTIPHFLFEHVAVLGFLISLTGGLAMFGVMTATGLRILVWLRDSTVHHWNQNTPPYTPIEVDSEPSPGKPSGQAIERAKEKAVAYFTFGSIWFLVISSALLLMEELAPDVLYGATSNPQLSSVGEVLNTAFFLIDIEGLVFEFAPNTTQTEITLIVFLFIIPGVWFVFSGRNLLLLTETMISESMREVQQKGLVSRPAFTLATLSLWFLGGIVTAAFDLFGS